MKETPEKEEKEQIRPKVKKFWREEFWDAVKKVGLLWAMSTILVLMTQAITGNDPMKAIWGSVAIMIIPIIFALFYYRRQFNLNDSLQIVYLTRDMKWFFHKEYIRMGSTNWDTTRLEYEEIHRLLTHPEVVKQVHEGFERVQAIKKPKIGKKEQKVITEKTPEVKKEVTTGTQTAQK